MMPRATRVERARTPSVAIAFERLAGLGWCEVVSSNVARVAHESDRLYVEFVSGATYLYEDVPAEKFDELRESASVGGFLNEQIKPEHTCARIVVT